MRGTESDNDHTDMRSDFEDAMETLGVNEEVEETPVAPADTGEVVEPETGAAEQLDPPVEAATGEPTEGPIEAAQAPNKDSMKAPIGWSPKQREDWSKIPRHLQEKIRAREKEIGQVMANTKTARMAHDALTAMTQQYGSLMAAEGAKDPIQAIDGMFKTVATLRTATQEQKAATIADMIDHYQIDVEALDNALVGKIGERNAVDPTEAKLQQMLEQRLAPFNELMSGISQSQQAQRQQQQQQALGQVKTFGAQAEFLNDVRHDMADLIDLAHKHGRQLSLQEAYDRACAVHPEVSKVMETRKRQQSIVGNNSSIAAKRNAASSISGRMAGSGGVNSDMSTRDMLQAAWDSQGS